MKSRMRIRFLKALLSSMVLLGQGICLPWKLCADPSASINLRLRVDIGPPDAISDLTALTGSNEGELNLSWTAVGNDGMLYGPPRSYQVRYSTFGNINNASDWSTATILIAEHLPTRQPGESETLTVGGLVPGATYYWAVSARDNFSITPTTWSRAGGVNLNNFAQAYDEPPAKVQGVTAIAGNAEVSLSWTDLTPTEKTSDFDFYRIYRSTHADLSQQDVIISTTSNSYLDTQVTNEVDYYYCVVGVDKGITSSPPFYGNALESITWSTVTAKPININVPFSPSNLQPVFISPTAILWQWQDRSTNETGFRIYASTGGLVNEIASSTGSGSLVQFTETNLIPNIYFSRFVRAFNANGESLSSNTTARFTLSNPPANTALSNVQFTSATISWSSNSNSTQTIYEVQRSASPDFSQVNLATTTLNSLSTLNLSSNTTYYFRVRAQNGEGVFTVFDSTVTALTQKLITVSAPTGLVATGGNAKVTLDWQDNIETELLGYYVYRSTVSDSSFAKITLSPITTSYFVDSGLANGTTYFYKVTAIVTGNLESDFSASVSVIPRKRSCPLPPSGFTGSFDSEGRFVLTWNPPIKNEDGTDATDISAYRIYRSTTSDDSPFLRDTLTANIFSWISTDSINSGYWYLVRAVNSFNDESADSTLIQIDSLRQIARVPDYTLKIKFEHEESKILNGKTNPYSEDIRMIVTRNASEEQGKVLTSYEIKFIGVVTDKEISDLVLPKPKLTLTFRYLTPPSSLKGTLSDEQIRKMNLRAFNGSSQDVSVFKYNEVEFIKLGGEVDSSEGIIQIRTSVPTGKYQIRQSLRATSFEITQTEPRKIFSPNDDGVNDIFTIYFENPRDSVVSQAKVYDLSGAEVSDLQLGSAGNSLSWNGKNKNGEFVNGGIYIYQIESEDKVINGTVVVFR